MMDYRVSITSGESVRQNDDSMSILNPSEFKLWFDQIQTGRILIPDTNALMNRSFSGLSLVLGSHYFLNTFIRIPRLTVLEMERIANEEKSNSEKKRKVMQAAAELLFIKNNSGIFLPELKDRTFESFSRIAGNKFTDAWIRREVQEEIERETYGKDPHVIKKPTLVTVDLINALSANAEGIDVIYLSRAASDDFLPRAHTLEQVTQFLIRCSVLFEEIRVSINKEKFIIKGVWQGKTPSEWITDSIMMDKNSDSL
jgi:hypothetical protein